MKRRREPPSSIARASSFGTVRIDFAASIRDHQRLGPERLGALRVALAPFDGLPCMASTLALFARRLRAHTP